MSKTRAWFIRFVTLAVFNLIVLLLIVIFLPSVHGRPFGLLWGALLLTVLTIWIKPLLSSAASSQADRLSQGRSAGARRGFGALAVLIVALVVWLLLVWFSSIRVQGWFWGYVIPPIALLIAWFIYDAIDDQLERSVTRAYDSVRGRRTPNP